MKYQDINNLLKEEKEIEIQIENLNRKAEVNLKKVKDIIKNNYFANFEKEKEELNAFYNKDYIKIMNTHLLVLLSSAVNVKHFVDLPSYFSSVSNVGLHYLYGLKRHRKCSSLKLLNEHSYSKFDDGVLTCYEDTFDLKVIVNHRNVERIKIVKANELIKDFFFIKAEREKLETKMLSKGDFADIEKIKTSSYIYYKSVLDMAKKIELLEKNYHEASASLATHNRMVNEIQNKWYEYNKKYRLTIELKGEKFKFNL